MRLIARLIIEFGILCSIFDMITFNAMLGRFAATPPLFRTGWFVESLLTELVVCLVIRTRRPFFASEPGRTLLFTTAAVAALALVIPYLPLVELIGFVPLSPPLLAALVLVTALYVLATETLKHRFYRATS